MKARQIIAFGWRMFSVPDLLTLTLTVTRTRTLIVTLTPTVTLP